MLIREKEDDVYDIVVYHLWATPEFSRVTRILIDDNNLFVRHLLQNLILYEQPLLC